MSGWPLFWISAATCILPLPHAAAQDSVPGNPFTIVSRTANLIATDPGSAISLVFSLESRARDPLTLVPSLGVPDGWSVITGSETFSLAPGQADTWVVSIFIPARAEAGRYSIRVGAHVGSGDSIPYASETIQVEITRKRALALALVDRPQYVISGDAYVVAFRLRNRGNGVATVRLSARSLLDPSPAVAAPIVRLAPDEATTISVGVRTRSAAPQRDDDVIELRATEDSVGGDSASAANASGRVLVVRPAGGNSPLATVPGTLRLRAANRNTGVSPFEFVGGGVIRTEREDRLDFMFHGKSGLNSPFGEERDNRVEISGPRYRARVGDNVFMPSTLTGVGQSGFGGGLEIRGALLSGGAHSQRFRYVPDNQSERTAYLALTPGGSLTGYRIALNAVNRTGGQLAGRVISSELRMKAAEDIVIDSELARSNAKTGAGSANSIRVTGGRDFRYDVGHVAGSKAYAGPSRNGQSDYATFSLPASRDLQLNATLNRSRFAVSADSALSLQQFATGTIGATYLGRFSLEYSGIGRSLGSQRRGLTETQRFAKARVDQSSRYGSSWIGLEMGGRGDSASNRGTYHQLQVGTSVRAHFGTLSLFTEFYDGGSLTRGLAGMSTLGGSASLRLTEATTLVVFGYGARNHVAGSHTSTQVDSRLTYALPRGSKLSLRGRSATTILGARTEKLAYLEYSLPIGVPTGRTRLLGRATGTVTDGESGRGVPGVLVRLGSEAGVTDRAGRVYFAGLPAGEYRASLASETPISGATYLASPAVRIDSTRREVAAFRLAVSRASKVTGTVRQFSTVRTALDSGADSLEYSGPVQGIMIALVSVADTLHTVTDLNGRFSFDHVPSGQSMIIVESVVPPPFRIEHPQVSVTTKPGEETSVDFRIIPKQKPVTIMGGS